MKKSIIMSTLTLIFVAGMLALTSCGGGEKDCDKKCDKTEECKKKCEKDGKACTGKKECKKGEKGEKSCGEDCKKACCADKAGHGEGHGHDAHGDAGHEGHGHGDAEGHGHEDHEGHDHAAVDSAA